MKKYHEFVTIVKLISIICISEKNYTVDTYRIKLTKNELISIINKDSHFANIKGSLYPIEL